MLKDWLKFQKTILGLILLAVVMVPSLALAQSVSSYSPNQLAALSISLQSLNDLLAKFIAIFYSPEQARAAQTVRHNYTIQSCYGGTNANNTCTSDADCSGGVCLNPVVAWWNLDEPSGTRAATGGSCGADCNLNESTGDTISQDATNKMEGSAAANFIDTDDESLNCADGTCNETDFTGSFTIGCWAKLGSAKNYNSIIQDWDYANKGGYYLWQQSSGQNRLLCQVYDGIDIQTAYSNVNSFSSGAFNHAICRYDANVSNIQIFINGVTNGNPISQSTPNGASNIQAFRISSSNTTQDWDGQLDECFAANQAYTNQQVCEICKFGLDGEELDRGAQCGSCDPGPAASPPSSDTTSPVLSNSSPAGQLPSGTTQTTLSLTTDENATCRYSTTAGVSYASMSNTFSTTGSTNHSTSITGLADGQTYTYYTRCQDTASNANPDDYTISFSVASPVPDTTPPTVSITTPANNSTVSGNTTVTATASDNIGVIGVTFFYDLVNQIADVLTAPFTTLWDTSAVTNGLHNLIARARDAVGNITTSSPVSVTVSNTSPSGSIYYVDPITGNNSNNGTSPSTPWQNPPGTRTPDDAGFWSTTWGSISTSNKIKCGDIIYLKGGSTQTSTEGGAWDIDSTYYTNNCTTGSRITIKVARNAEWTGANGHFTLDAAGVVPAIAGTTCDWPGIVALRSLNFFQVLGRSENARLHITHGLTAHAFTVPTQCWASSFYPTGIVATGASHQGLRFDWIEISDTYFGVQVGRYNNWQVSNIIVSGVKSGGLLTGLAADRTVDGGAYVNATVHDSGCGSSALPDCTEDTRGQADAFNFTGQVNMWCVNCTAYNNGERGMSGGVVYNPSMTDDFVSHWRNLVAHSNGAKCGAGQNCTGSGLRPSGNTWYNEALARNYTVGLISWGQRHDGEAAYGGAHSEVWHATTYYNGFSPQGGAEHNLLTDNRYQGLINSITMQYVGSIGAYIAGDSSGGNRPRGTFTPGAFNNCYRPASSDTQALGASAVWDYNQLCTANQVPYSCCTGSGTGTCNGTGWPGVGTYAAPPAWIGPTNKVGLAACDPKFTALSTSSFAANDFNLQSDSTAIDAGRFLMLANGAGSNATTLTIQANGGGSDPRYYFISPTSYLDAVADTIQIKDAVCQGAAAELGSAERAKIVSMTATAITLDRFCTWADGAGVHLPWEGTAPDIGAFEYTGSTPPPPPPTFDFSLSNSGNLSVSQGSSTQTTITATLTTGTPASLNFSATGLPTGATASFSPVSCSPNCSTTLTITTPASTPLGNSTITVTAIGGGTTKTTSFTLTISDTTFPAITFSSVSSVTQTSATISFTTDELATNQIEYGFTPSYGASTPLATSYVTNHSITLSNLSASTTFNYRIHAFDSAGNETIGINRSFTTLPSVTPDTTPPSAITNLAASQISQTSADIPWTSPGDNGIEGTSASYDLRYSTSAITDANFNSTTQATGLPTPKLAGSSEVYVLAGLSPSTTYFVAIQSTDSAGNTSLLSNIATFTTLAVTQPPPPPVPPPVGGSGGGGGGGGGSGGGGGGYFDDTIPPSVPSNATTTSLNNQITLRWKNPPDTDFVRVAIVRNASSSPTSKTDGTLIYEGSKEEFSDIDLDNTKTYHYAIYAYDKKPNYSSPAMLSAQPQAGVETTSITVPVPPPLQQTQGKQPCIPQTIPGLTLTRSLALGSTGADIKLLQQYLNTNGFIIAQSGPGSPGNESTYFGSLTVKAIQRFQAQNGIVTSGSPETTGYGAVGPKTRGVFAKSTMKTSCDVSVLPKPKVTTAISLFGPFSVGITSPQVTLLQQLLAKDTNIYPEGLMTGFYGPLTVKAVQRFQTKYNILTSGSPDTTGYGLAGPRTRERITEILGR